MLVDEAGGSCVVCGYDRCIINLHFHHVDPTKKSFAMTVAMGKSIATFRKEAEKCVLVCANCHGEIEARLIECPPLGATYATYGARLAREESVLPVH
jgi:cytochrome c553